MKKFIRVCMITALVLILLGGSICAIGAVSGGFRLLRDASNYDTAGVRYWAEVASYGARHGWKEGWYNDWKEEWSDAWEDAGEEWADTWNDIGEEWEYAWEDAHEEWEDVHEEYEHAHEAYEHAIEDWDEEWADDYGDEDDLWFPADGEYYTLSLAGYVNTSLTSKEVSNLAIDAGGTALYIRQSEDENFGLEKEGVGRYRYYERNGTLYIEGKRKNLNGALLEESKEHIILYVPEGMQFKNVSIDVGAGVAELGTLRADNVELEIGAGRMTADRITGRSIAADVGAGEMKLKDIAAQELELSVEVGKAEVKGNITSKLDIECGVGAVGIALAQSEKNFNYEVECGVGSIRIGEKSYTALSEEKIINNKAAGICTLDCSMGNIRMSFGQ